MDLLRTPDERFRDLPSWPFEPRYVDAAGVRMHHVDEGPPAAAPVLLLHGEPSWSFLYRKMIPVLVAAGHRVVAPDLVGFGRSDKPARQEDYTYQRHVGWLTAFLTALDLRDVSLFCQDWGGLLGLRLVAEHSGRFARVVASNTGLPTGEERVSEAFLAWQAFSQSVEALPVGRIIQTGCTRPLPPEVVAAYEAPFPEERFKAGARQFPLLVPTRPDDPAHDANVAAWASLARFDRPFLTAFGDSDPVTRGADRPMRERIPGAQGQPHTTVAKAGHFIQEDAGEDVARLLVDFIERTR
ncbi:MAG TPA: haloalkane dehalogenase [Polyangiaceae bacterium]|jgi:haloalkane dehalogenase